MMLIFKAFIILIQLAQFTDCFTSLIAAGRYSSVNGKHVALRVTKSASAESSHNRGDEKVKNKKKSFKRKRNNRNNFRSRSSLETEFKSWRIFGVNVHPDELAKDKDSISIENDQSIDQRYVTPAVLQSLCRRLKVKVPSERNDLPSEIQNVRVVRRSLDARRRLFRSASGPQYTYVLDMETRLCLKEQMGRQEILHEISSGGETSKSVTDCEQPDEAAKAKTVIIVGAGPAGLFCALSLLSQSDNIKPIVLERGQSVESRSKDVGALIHKFLLNTESNYCFGEGGAGTFSDGKLTTRIGRNSQAVRWVLETFVKYGATEKILMEGAPHLGTDKLVGIMKNMRLAIRDQGGEILFGAKVTDILIEDGTAAGVEVSYSEAVERGPGGAVRQGPQQGVETMMAEGGVVLATGHSARDFYETLHGKGVQLEAKGFAAGFRVEHPQRLVNEFQYGHEWGPTVITGKRPTDSANIEHFKNLGKDNLKTHRGMLPVPSYRLATDKAYDGTQYRGAYSFCMCPGGQIVQASTDSDCVCVNGMSYSRRDSVWANSALVVTVAPDDPILDSYREDHGVLAGIAFQRDMEQRAARLGGGNFTVPVQRLTDFLAGRASETAPSSSYRLGIKPAACHEIYPEPMTIALRDALTNYFNKQLPGFISEEALLHAVETRTSSPVRISRDSKTLQAVGTNGLYPSGEGAGFAGGIVSAAVDGISVAEAVLQNILCENYDTKLSLTKHSKSVGFDY